MKHVFISVWASSLIYFSFFFVISEALSILVLGESNLEKYLLEHPPNDENIPLAKTELKESLVQLQDALKASPKVRNSILSLHLHKTLKCCIVSSHSVHPKLIAFQIIKVNTVFYFSSRQSKSRSSFFWQNFTIRWGIT